MPRWTRSRRGTHAPGCYASWPAIRPTVAAELAGGDGEGTAATMAVAPSPSRPAPLLDQPQGERVAVQHALVRLDRRDDGEHQPADADDDPQRDRDDQADAERHHRQQE